MSTLALAVSPATVRPRVAWRVFLALAGSWLVAGLAQLELKLPFTPVPITGQTLGVLLVGASLGTGLGVISMALYLLQGATGVYLFGFVLAAAAVGWLSECGWDRTLRSSIGAMFLGEVVLYSVGIPWLMQALDVSLARALELGLAPFVIGDTLKLLLAAELLPAGWRLAKK